MINVGSSLHGDSLGERTKFECIDGEITKLLNLEVKIDRYDRTQLRCQVSTIQAKKTTNSIQFRSQ